MSVRFLKPINMPFAATATPIHDGSNSEGYQSTVEGFIVQSYGGDVYLGESSVTGKTNGLTIKEGEGLNVVGFLSRGSPYSYDLTRIFYVGGPWTMIIEAVAK
ncbi:MAG: hypothetical protein E6R04_04785 [Spirochaetes bacterium]|nr:MAG: hypothetical protein E6R04_04785 [Spirochaetota bacterium]